MSDSESENNTGLETCGVCGDTYNIKVEKERGNNANLCNYHFGHRFGGYDTESEDDDELVIYDESCKKETFAAQDWRQSEVDELLLMLEAPKFPGLITVTEDEWEVEDGVWMLVYKGRNGAECLQDLLEAPVLDYDTKKLICHFLTHNKVTPRKHYLELFDSCRWCFFRLELLRFRTLRAVHCIDNDRMRGLNDKVYSGFYHGRLSYCVRCGDHKSNQRYNLVLHGLCLDCGYAGLMHNHRDENFNNLPDFEQRLGHLISPRRIQFSIIQVMEGVVPRRRPINFGLVLPLRDFDLEWPELEHPQWIAGWTEPEVVVE